MDGVIVHILREPLQLPSALLSERPGPSEISNLACSRHSKSPNRPRASLSDCVWIYLGLLSILDDVYYHLRFFSSLTLSLKVQIARISLYLSRYYNAQLNPQEYCLSERLGLTFGAP